MMYEAQRHTEYTADAFSAFLTHINLVAQLSVIVNDGSNLN